MRGDVRNHWFSSAAAQPSRDSGGALEEPRIDDALERIYEGTESELRRIFTVKRTKAEKKKPEGKFGSKKKRPLREGKMAGAQEIASAVAWNQRATVQIQIQSIPSREIPALLSHILTKGRWQLGLVPTTRCNESTSRISHCGPDHASSSSSSLCSVSRSSMR